MLVCGLATLDVVQTVERVPGPNEKVVATGLAVAAGGPAANAAVTCAALGVGVRLVTRVGGGPLGAAVAGDLAAAGVEVVDLAGPDGTPPVSTVLVTRGTGERAVVSVNATRGAGQGAGAGAPGAGAPGAGAPGGDVPGAAGAPAAAWDGVGVLLVDGHHLDLTLAAAAEARTRGVPVLLDGGSWKPGLEALLGLVDVAVLSGDFAAPPGGGGLDVLDFVHGYGPRVVARSAGAGPIEVRLPDGARVRAPVPRVDVVDTLGAGDVLHGALAAWLAARWAARWEAHGARGAPDVVAGLRWAAAVASASCTAAGARGWADDRALVARLRGELA